VLNQAAESGRSERMLPARERVDRGGSSKVTERRYKVISTAQLGAHASPGPASLPPHGSGSEEALLDPGEAQTEGGSDLH